MQLFKVHITTLKISDFITLQKNKLLDLTPYFQRRPVWSKGAKSFFIDTIVHGFPIPIIILRDRPTKLDTYEPIREVIDGQQRIRTILSYITPNLINDLKDEDIFTVQKVHNPEIAGLPFAKLPSDIKQRILDYEFSVHVFPSDTSDIDILQIFARINSTGVKLNDQELRNASWFGAFKTLMYNLAYSHLNYWRDWGLFKSYDISRMKEVELTSELVILMLSGIRSRNQKYIDNIYKDFDAKFDRSDIVKRRFGYIFKSMNDVLSTEVTNEILSKFARIYGLFGAFYHFHYGLDSKLDSTKAKALTGQVRGDIIRKSMAILNGSAPEKVRNALARRTTNIDSRTNLIEYLIK